METVTTGGDPSYSPGRRLAVNTAVFAWEWARNLAGTSWVPDDRTVVAERLRLLAERAVAVLRTDEHANGARAEGSSPHGPDVSDLEREIGSVGREIGAGLVKIGFNSPEALGRTLELIAGRLLIDLGLDASDAATRARLNGLLGAVAVGFSRAARDRTLAEQDSIRGSYLVARQRAEEALRAHVAERAPAAVTRTGLPRDDFQEEFPAALARGDIATYYQPIVTLDDGTLIGAEALARWRHPKKGVLPPASFLPAAAREGLFVALGRRQREDACRAAVEWQQVAGRPVFVGVNLVSAELRDPGLVDDVRSVLDRTGLAPELLHLEIIEDTVLADVDLPVLRSLAATGVQLTLDDFGTGVSRLAKLPSLPISGLKLASELLDPLRHLPFEAAQVGTEVLVAVVGLARRLGLTTTIEGIETEAEAELARRLGVARAQGWLYGRPTPAEGVSGLLRPSPASDGPPGPIPS